MSKLLDKWNKNKFSIYKSEEKTVLKLIENINNFNGELAEEMNQKTDLMGDHKGTWQGLSKPTLSEEGMRATVEKINEVELPIIKKKIENTEHTQSALHLSRLGKKYVNMGDTYNSIQGMTYLENDICICAYASDKTGNMVRLDKINIKSGNVIISKEIALGHANDLCYDGEFIYVTMTTDYTNGVDVQKVIKLNKSNLSIVDTIVNPNTGLSSWGGLAYDNKTKQFYITSFEERNQCEIYDSKFKYVKTISLKQETYIETGYQILSAFNGKLYQVTTNPEVIYEFDTDGKLLKVYNISEYQGIYKTGEIQGLVFREDGKCYIRTVAKLSRLSNGIEQFWITDLATNVNNSNNRFSSAYGQRSDLTMIVDSTTEYYNSTGLPSAPFNSLEEMILSLHAPEFQDEQLTVDIKTSFKNSNLYIIGCNNISFYCNNNQINSIYLMGCNNVNVYDYVITGFMNGAQVKIFNSDVKLGGGSVTKANATHTALIERSKVMTDGSSIGIFVESPKITVKAMCDITITDRDNKTINGLEKDNSSKLRTVRLLKGELTKDPITVPSDINNYTNVEVRYKFPRNAFGTYKWLDRTIVPRCSSTLSNTNGLTVYDAWFTLEGGTLASGGTRGVIMTANNYTYETPEILWDIALYD